MHACVKTIVHMRLQLLRLVCSRGCVVRCVGSWTPGNPVALFAKHVEEKEHTFSLCNGMRWGSMTRDGSTTTAARQHERLSMAPHTHDYIKTRHTRWTTWVVHVTISTAAQKNSETTR